MTEQIKVSEVSSILRQQLEGIHTSIKLEEVGTVLQVSDGVARIYGLDNAEANELLQFDNGMEAIVMNLEEDNVGAVLLGPTDQIKEGDTVKRTGRIASIDVSEGMIGRVIDPLGNPIDGKGEILGETCEMPLERKAPGVIFRQPVNEPLQTGIKAVDAMIPIGRGQRELIIGDRQTGKTSIAIDTIINPYKEGSAEAKATFTVTVAGDVNPREDTKTPLKDTSGRQLYVSIGDNQYRAAAYADYYTATKFFLMEEARYTGWQTLDGKVYFFKADGSKVTGEQVIQGAKYNFASDGSLVVGSGTMGIDVSKWNGSIDWNAVKNSGVNYVIIRVGYRGSSQGALIEDPKFKTNIKGATAAGLKVGVYFFTQAVDEVEAVQEASMVLDRISGYKISYPVFLDVEGSGGRGDAIDSATRTAVCKAFCNTIKNAGYTPGVYANKTWLTSKMDAGALSGYKIWLAQYAKTPTYTGRYDLWQYRSDGKVSGISGKVDLNISYLGY